MILYFPWTNIVGWSKQNELIMSMLWWTSEAYLGLCQTSVIGLYWLKLIFLHGCFSRFLNCTNATKSRNASQIVDSLLCLPFYYILTKKAFQKLWKVLFISSKKPFSFLRYSIFCNFSLSFPQLHTEKVRWNWYNYDVWTS